MKHTRIRVFLAVVLAMGLAVGAGMESLAKQASSQDPPSSVRVPSARRMIKGVTPRCPAGYSYKASLGTCAKYVSPRPCPRPCHVNPLTMRCTGPGNCTSLSACPGAGCGPSETPAICRCTRDPICPARYTWDRGTKKCKPQELRSPR